MKKRKSKKRTPVTTMKTVGELQAALNVTLPSERAMGIAEMIYNGRKKRGLQASAEMIDAALRIDRAQGFNEGVRVANATNHTKMLNGLVRLYAGAPPRDPLMPIPVSGPLFAEIINALRGAGYGVQQDGEQRWEAKATADGKIVAERK